MSFFGRTLSRLRKQRAYSRLVEELQRLDDRMLDDLGIPRHQIEAIARNVVEGEREPRDVA